MLTTYTPTTTSNQGANWLRAARPQIVVNVPHAAFRAVRQACRLVDLDIERDGTVTYETVERVRSALALVRKLAPAA